MKDKGFTLIELLVVISIISLLSSVVLSALNTARSKGRYATMATQMREIQIAATAYFSDYGAHAPDVGPGSAPALVPTYMSAWPKPPCGSGWSYDWDNWTTGNGFVGVHLYQTGVGAQYHFCVDRASTCTGGGGQNVQTMTSKSLSC